MPVDVTLAIYARPGGTNPGQYRRGDIVAVYPRSLTPEDPAPGSGVFFIDVDQVPVAALEKAQALMQQDQDSIDGTKPTGGRCTWYLDPDSVPPVKRAELLATRRTTATVAQLKAVVKKRDGNAALRDEDLA